MIIVPRSTDRGRLPSPGRRPTVWLSDLVFFRVSWLGAFVAYGAFVIIEWLELYASRKRGSLLVCSGGPPCSSSSWLSTPPCAPPRSSDQHLAPSELRVPLLPASSSQPGRAAAYDGAVSGSE